MLHCFVTKMEDASKQSRPEGKQFWSYRDIELESHRPTLSDCVCQEGESEYIRMNCVSNLIWLAFWKGQKSDSPRENWKNVPCAETSHQNNLHEATMCPFHIRQWDNEEMRTFNPSTLRSASFGTNGSHWTWRTSLSSKHLSLKTTKQLNYKHFPSRQSPYKEPPPWIKYLKLHLVNSTFSLFIELIGNIKRTSPVTLDSSPYVKQLKPSNTMVR